MKAYSIFTAVVAFGVGSQACQSGSGALPGANGGSSGNRSGGVSGGNGGGSTGAAGTTQNGGGGSSGGNATACGGNLAGTWTAMGSTLKIGGSLDPSLVGATTCPAPGVTGSLQVAGMFTANADGTFSDGTMTSGQENFPLDKACLIISSTPTTCEKVGGLFSTLGYSEVDCTSAADGGCTCAATVAQPGGLGLLQGEPPTSGNYKTGDGVLTIATDSGDVKYSYCVSGTTLTITPQSTSPTISGSIVFQKMGAGATGAGGTTGTGNAGMGGIAGASGSAGNGGAPGSGGVGGGAGAASTGAGGGPATGGASGMGPCDIYKSGGTPCVAAHSTTRALFGAYNGKLYQVRNAAGTTKDIMTLAPGGAADGAAQDTFCSGTTCIVTVVYDQTGKGNDLWYQGSTMVPGSTSSSAASATKESLTLSGHKVYSLYINAGNSYWVDASKTGIALKADPEGMYMVTSTKHVNDQCCFDYGNSETDRKADAQGAMDAVNFSKMKFWGTGAGSGPWVMADLEAGVYAQADEASNAADVAQTAPYVTAILKNNGTTEFALRGGDANGTKLDTFYRGKLPNGYNPMKKQGAIVLGSGGDCCKPGGGANLSAGTFYEGAIVVGYPSDATEDAVQASIAAAGYGK